jgi:hypothetical protein
MEQLIEKYKQITLEIKSELEKTIVEKLNNIESVDYVVWEQYIDASDGDISIRDSQYARIGINNPDEENEFDDYNIPSELQSKKKEIFELLSFIGGIDTFLMLSFYGYDGVKVIIDKNGKVTVEDYHGYY